MNIHEQLARLRAEYVATLGARCDALEAVFTEMRSGDDGQRASLRDGALRTLHNFVGGAGTHGLDAVASAAERLEARLAVTSPADAAPIAEWPESAELIGALRHAR